MTKMQKAGDWAEHEFSGRKCPFCLVDYSSLEIVNKPALDIKCSGCDERFEVKATTNAAASKARSGSYKSYHSIFKENPPNLVLVVYRAEGSGFAMTRMEVVPRALLDESIVREDKPFMAGTQKRQMCSLKLDEIPRVGRVPLVANGVELRGDRQAQVLARWTDLKEKGVWVRETLRIVSMLNRPDFEMKDLRCFESYLKERHPGAQTPLKTVARVLQGLRDAGVVEFRSKGSYVLAAT